MRVYIDDNELVIMIEPKPIRVNLTKVVDNNLKHDIDLIMKRKGFLAVPVIKKYIKQLLSKYKHGSANHEHAK